MAGTKPAQVTTALAAPVGAYSASNSGSIAVKVFNAAGAARRASTCASSRPRAERPTRSRRRPKVARSSRSCRWAPTRCRSSKAPASVTRRCSSRSSDVGLGRADGVDVVRTTTPPATINVTGCSNETVATPVTGLAMSVANTGLQPYGQCSGAAGNNSLTPLFPYTSGYTVFAGNCTDNNPIGKDTTGNLFYPTAAPVPITVTAGAHRVDNGAALRRRRTRRKLPSGTAQSNGDRNDEVEDELRVAQHGQLHERDFERQCADTRARRNRMPLATRSPRFRSATSRSPQQRPVARPAR